MQYGRNIILYSVVPSTFPIFLFSYSKRSLRKIRLLLFSFVSASSFYVEDITLRDRQRTLDSDEQKNKVQRKRLEGYADRLEKKENEMNEASHGETWNCICGNVNVLSTKKCLRCERTFTQSKNRAEPSKKKRVAWTRASGKAKAKAKPAPGPKAAPKRPAQEAALQEAKKPRSEL